MSSILIIGNGKNNQFLTQIYQFSKEQVSALFSGSKLKEAYEMCIPYFDKVYLANAKTPLDYIEISKCIDESRYDYICPLDIYSSDEILLDGKKAAVCSVMLDVIRPNHSVFIFSDLYADAFFSIEQFIQHYNRVSYQLYSSIQNTEYSKKVIFVANHFKKTQLAQIAFAVDHLNSPCNVYIKCTNGNSYYDLNVQDFSTPLVFVKNNTLIGSTYENLINFSHDVPEKFILVERISSYVKGKLEFNWAGKRLAKGIIVAQLKTLLESKLEELKGFCIDGYSIDKIEILKYSAYYEIHTYITILPVLHTNAYSFVLRKKV